MRFSQSAFSMFTLSALLAGLGASQAVGGADVSEMRITSSYSGAYSTQATPSPYGFEKRATKSSSLSASGGKVGSGGQATVTALVTCPSEKPTTFPKLTGLCSKSSCLAKITSAPASVILEKGAKIFDIAAVPSICAKRGAVPSDPAGKKLGAAGAGAGASGSSKTASSASTKATKAARSEPKEHRQHSRDTLLAKRVPIEVSEGGLKYAAAGKAMLTRNLQQCMSLYAIDGTGKQVLAHIFPATQDGDNKGYGSGQDQYVNWAMKVHEKLNAATITVVISRPGKVATGTNMFNVDVVRDISKWVYERFPDKVSIYTRAPIKNNNIHIVNGAPVGTYDVVLGAFTVSATRQIEVPARWYVGHLDGSFSDHEDQITIPPISLSNTWEM